MKQIIKLESSTESAYVEWVELFGYECLKIKKVGYPDRLTTLSNGYGFYIEFKRQGEKPDKIQLHIHIKLRKKGYHVYVCDSLQAAKSALIYEELKQKQHVQFFKEL